MCHSEIQKYTVLSTVYISYVTATLAHHQPKWHVSVEEVSAVEAAATVVAAATAEAAAATVVSAVEVGGTAAAVEATVEEADSVEVPEEAMVVAAVGSAGDIVEAMAVQGVDTEEAAVGIGEAPVAEDSEAVLGVAVDTEVDSVAATVAEVALAVEGVGMAVGAQEAPAPTVDGAGRVVPLRASVRVPRTTDKVHPEVAVASNQTVYIQGAYQFQNL